MKLEKALNNLHYIEALELDWDGEGSKPFSKMIIGAIIEFLNNNDEIPHDIYPIVNEIILEWQYESKIIKRICFTDLKDSICVEQMISYPDKPSSFELLRVIRK